VSVLFLAFFDAAARATFFGVSAFFVAGFVNALFGSLEDVARTRFEVFDARATDRRQGSFKTMCLVDLDLKTLKGDGRARRRGD
jgi:hypothetical protein